MKHLFLLILASIAFAQINYEENAYLSATSTDITFQADVSWLLLDGVFNPSSQYIEIRGDMNGWGAGNQLQQNAGNDSLYEITLSLNYNEGANINWLFYGGPWGEFGNNGYEIGSNRQLIMPSVVTILEPIQPSLIGALPINQDMTVRFSVDMTNASDVENGAPLENIRSIWLNGDWCNNGSGFCEDFSVLADTSNLLRLYDDGISAGDETAYDQIWTGEVVFSQSSPAGHTYFYVCYNEGNNLLIREGGWDDVRYININDENTLYTQRTDTWLIQSENEGTGGRISGSVSLTEDHPFGQVQIILYLPGGGTLVQQWGEDPPFDVNYFFEDPAIAEGGPYRVEASFDLNDNNQYDGGEPYYTTGDLYVPASNVLENIDLSLVSGGAGFSIDFGATGGYARSEEHTSELQSHSFISYAVFCLKKKKKKKHIYTPVTFLYAVC